jgi:DNA gyrase subunit B
VPGLKIAVRDERKLPGTPGELGAHEEVFHHDGGISEFVEFLAADSGVTDVWRLHGAGKFKETVPVLDDKGHSKMAEVERDCEVDVALRWGIGYDTSVRSFVNIISTPKGGTHQAGFEQALVKTFRKTVEANARKLKVGNDKIEKDDIFAGLTAVLTVRLAEPQFEGQTKEILGTSAVGHRGPGGGEGAQAKLTPTKRNDKAQSALLLEKVVSEMKSRISARVAQGDPAPQDRARVVVAARQARRLPHRRRRPQPSCSSSRATPALGTAKLARSSDFQALLPIRGKILNVQKASVGDMLSNAECAAIIQVVGAGSGRSFDDRGRALREGHPDDRRRRRRRAHPHPAAHPVLPLHAAHGRGGPGLRRRAAAAPGGSHQPRPEGQRDDLHLFRG